jgi:hypothetical protein
MDTFVTFWLPIVDRANERRKRMVVADGTAYATASSAGFLGGRAARRRVFSGRGRRMCISAGSGRDTFWAFWLTACNWTMCRTWSSFGRTDRVVHNTTGLP